MESNLGSLQNYHHKHPFKWIPSFLNSQSVAPRNSLRVQSLMNISKQNRRKGKFGTQIVNSNVSFNTQKNVEFQQVDNGSAVQINIQQQRASQSNDGKSNRKKTHIILQEIQEQRRDSLNQVMKKQKEQEEHKDQIQKRWLMAQRAIPKPMSLIKTMILASKEDQIVKLLKKPNRSLQDVEELTKLTAHLEYFRHLNSNEAYENLQNFFKNNLFICYVGTKIPSGGVFGERGLDANSTRAATVIANEDCFLASLSKAQYKQNLEEISRKKMEKKIDFLKPILNGNKELSTEKMSKINFIFQAQKYQIGQQILQEGQEFSGFYLIKKGDIELVKNKSQPQQCSQQNTPQQLSHIYPEIQMQRLALLGSGEFFGEECIYEKEERASYSAIVKSNKCTVFYISKHYFNNFISAQENQDISTILRGKHLLKKQFLNKQLKVQQKLHSQIISDMKAKQEEKMQIKMSLKELIDHENSSEIIRIKNQNEYQKSPPLQEQHEKNQKEDHSLMMDHISQKPIPQFSSKLIQNVKANEQIMKKIDPGKKNNYDFYMQMRDILFTEKELKYLSKMKNATFKEVSPAQNQKGKDCCQHSVLANKNDTLNSIDNSQNKTFYLQKIQNMIKLNNKGHQKQKIILDEEQQLTRKSSMISSPITMNNCNFTNAFNSFKENKSQFFGNGKEEKDKNSNSDQSIENNLQSQHFGRISSFMNQTHQNQIPKKSSSFYSNSQNKATTTNNNNSTVMLKAKSSYSRKREIEKYKKKLYENVPSYNHIANSNFDQEDDQQNKRDSSQQKSISYAPKHFQNSFIHIKDSEQITKPVNQSQKAFQIRTQSCQNIANVGQNQNTQHNKSFQKLQQFYQIKNSATSIVDISSRKSSQNLYRTLKCQPQDNNSRVKFISLPPSPKNTFQETADNSNEFNHTQSSGQYFKTFNFQFNEINKDQNRGFKQDKFREKQKSLILIRVNNKKNNISFEKKLQKPMSNQIQYRSAMQKSDNNMHKTQHYFQGLDESDNNHNTSQQQIREKSSTSIKYNFQQDGKQSVNNMAFVKKRLDFRTSIDYSNSRTGKIGANQTFGQKNIISQFHSLMSSPARSPSQSFIINNNLSKSGQNNIKTKLPTQSLINSIDTSRIKNIQKYQEKNSSESQ